MQRCARTRRKLARAYFIASLDIIDLDAVKSKNGLQMDIILRLTSVFDGWVWVGLVWHGFILVYCQLVFWTWLVSSRLTVLDWLSLNSFSAYCVIVNMLFSFITGSCGNPWNCWQHPHHHLVLQKKE